MCSFIFTKMWLKSRGMSLFTGSLRSFCHQVNLAAVIAHRCIAPNRDGSLLASGVFSRFLHACGIHGKCVFLMSLYDWQEVRKCSSVTNLFCVPWEQSVFS